jgi:hypothetical protein
MALRLAGHVVRGLEEGGLRNLEDMTLCFQGRPVSLWVCKLSRHCGCFRQ